MEDFLKQAKYIWIYITTQCPFSCDYCYFSSKNSLEQTELPQKDLERLLELLPKNTNSEFIISGGEPMISPNFFNYIRMIRNKFPEKDIIIQTTNCFLKDEYIPTLKELGVKMEVSMDGTYESMGSNRNFLSKELWNKLFENAEKLKHENIPIATTLTINPLRVFNLFQDVFFLDRQGVKNLDLSPAFWTKWGKREFFLFKKEYDKIFNYILKNRKFDLLCYSYDLPMERYAWSEVNFLPSDSLFPSWLYLNNLIGEELAIGSIKEGELRTNEGALNEFNELFGKRQWSCRRKMNVAIAENILEYLPPNSFDLTYFKKVNSYLSYHNRILYTIRQKGI